MPCHIVNIPIVGYRSKVPSMKGPLRDSKENIGRQEFKPADLKGKAAKAQRADELLPKCRV